jgi:hypothetical protein
MNVCLHFSELWRKGTSDGEVSPRAHKGLGKDFPSSNSSSNSVNTFLFSTIPAPMIKSARQYVDNFKSESQQPQKDLYILGLNQASGCGKTKVAFDLAAQEHIVVYLCPSYKGA